MWTFVSPKIVFGEDALDEIGTLSIERALIVTDRAVRSLGLVDPVTERLAGIGAQWEVFDAVEPDPSIPAVLAGAETARRFEPDWIVGVGGGSPLDVAKAIWVLYERPDLQPAEINPFIDLGLRKLARLMTIPTTSGTGADVTWAIVLTDPVEKRKMGLGNRENVADIALVDPAMAAGMPPQLTADTGLDALTHAIEGFTCTWHTDLTDGLCLNAAAEIFTVLPRAVEDGTDIEARTRMHHAATAAGLGFGNAMASIAHAMGHALGSAFDLPHGRAVALCLPYTLEFAAAKAPDRAALLASHLGVSDAGGEPASRALADAVRNLAETIGNPLFLADAGVPRHALDEALDKLVDDAENDTQMITAPRSPSTEELRRLFVAAHTGNSVSF